jgi:hypothetical protein
MGSYAYDFLNDSILLNESLIDEGYRGIPAPNLQVLAQYTMLLYTPLEPKMGGLHYHSSIQTLSCIMGKPFGLRTAIYHP